MPCCACLQECHSRSWNVVGAFMKENLTQFIGRMSDSDTVMASSRTWVRQMSADLGGSPEDHGIFVWLNIPAIGVMSAGRVNFILSYLTQLMADHPTNAICFVVHANRASQQEGRTEPDENMWWCQLAKKTSTRKIIIHT